MSVTLATCLTPRLTTCLTPHLTLLTHPRVSPHVSPCVSPHLPQVCVSAGGRGTQEVSVSAARRLFSLVQSLILHWRPSKGGGVSSANQTAEILGVVQRLHPVPSGWRSVSHTHTHKHMHTDTHMHTTLSDWSSTFTSGSSTYQELRGTKGRSSTAASWRTETRGQCFPTTRM